MNSSGQDAFPQGMEAEFVLFVLSRCGQRECPAVPQLSSVQWGAHSPWLSKPGAEAAQCRQLQETQYQEDRLIQFLRPQRQKKKTLPGVQAAFTLTLSSSHSVSALEELGLFFEEHSGGWTGNTSAAHWVPHDSCPLKTWLTGKPEFRLQWDTL